MSKWERFIIYPAILFILYFSYQASQSKTFKGGLVITNSKGKPSIKLTTTEAGTGQIYLFNKNESTAIRMGYDGIVLNDPDGKEQAWIGPTKTGYKAGCIELSTPDGLCVTRIGYREAGGFVDTFSPKGVPLACLGSMNVPTGNSSDLIPAGGIITYGFKGKPVASFGITSKGDGVFTLWDRDYMPTMIFPQKK